MPVLSPLCPHPVPSFPPVCIRVLPHPPFFIFSFGSIDPILRIPKTYCSIHHTILHGASPAPALCPSTSTEPPRMSPTRASHVSQPAGQEPAEDYPPLSPISKRFVSFGKRQLIALLCKWDHLKNQLRSISSRVTSYSSIGEAASGPRARSRRSRLEPTAHL